MASGIKTLICFVAVTLARPGSCRDEDRIMKACYWSYELYEPCFAGCAEVTCDNPRNHLRPCYPYCEPGCICEEPYVRDDRTHQCVLPQDCSPTQMGIPVPTRHPGKYNTNTLTQPNSNSDSNSNTNSNPNANSNNNYNMRRYYARKEEVIPQVQENEAFSINEPTNYHQKMPNDVSRMGNYFNIVIAPPPIRALLPRKVLQGDTRRSPPKRIL